jgi:hypothetical protein
MPLNSTVMGPGPDRAGRRFAGRRWAGLRFCAGFRLAGFFRAWLPDGRLRGGEDVRVAMAKA